ncbi:MAG: hypothetical protein NTU49_05820 [Gammaproteobacteria bacterium]|nr:hypothetical protein [Gammaproteobacteria bacterium]
MPPKRESSETNNFHSVVYVKNPLQFPMQHSHLSKLPPEMFGIILLFCDFRDVIGLYALSRLRRPYYAEIKRQFPEFDFTKEDHKELLFVTQAIFHLLKKHQWNNKKIWIPLSFLRSFFDPFFSSQFGLPSLSLSLGSLNIAKFDDSNSPDFNQKIRYDLSDYNGQLCFPIQSELQFHEKHFFDDSNKRMGVFIFLWTALLTSLGLAISVSASAEEARSTGLIVTAVLSAASIMGIIWNVRCFQLNQCYPKDNRAHCLTFDVIERIQAFFHKQNAQTEAAEPLMQARDSEWQIEYSLWQQKRRESQRSPQLSDEPSVFPIATS